MVMSALSAPLYAKALIDSLLRRKSKFVVTPKGDSASPDTWFGTFRYHWYFIGIFAASVVAGFVLGHSHPAMVTWAAFAMLITGFPVFVWRHELRQARKRPRPVADAPAGAGTQAQDTVPAQGSPRAPHAPQRRPGWAAPHGGPGAGPNGEHDENMQTALGGLGGRKE
jgi:hypothetical protein